MSIDMSQFYQVFFEESAEHLASMESLLLTLDVDAPDPDQLNAIFRAAHSIKGSSGTFGFTDMTEVTHELETLLDRIRKNELAITVDMVDTFLQAGDVLRGLLDAHQNGNVMDGLASMEIRARLERLTGNRGPEHAQEGMPGSTAANLPQQESTSTAESASPADSVQPTYQIRFPNTISAFPSKTHLNNLLKELTRIGKISNRKITPRSVQLSLTTHASEAELHEIFSFFLKPKQISITVQGSTMKSTSGAQSTDEAEYGFFIEPEQIIAAVEDAQGYGFFVDPNVSAGAAKAEAENAQGYGFFTAVENQTQPSGETPAQSQAPMADLRKQEASGRRTTDTTAATAGETSIRVSVVKVDQMVNLVGELVITQAMLAETASNMDPALHERLISGLAQLDRNTRDLQDSVMSVRMMPINVVFSRFQRVVRDGAVKLGKKVQLKIVGEGTELDKGLIEKINDPLNHLVRNSLDHGIESPNERVAKGKDALGTITLRAAHQGGNIVIEVSDDGAGLNREKILAKAREKGMLAKDTMGDTLSDAEVWQMTFAPGFSTATVVTDVSGRGVGMDVVKKNIESIGGRVEIVSRQEQGCTTTIRLPLTLAILDGLSIAVGDQIYIIPLNFISESIQPKPEDLKEISGQGQVVHVRGEYLPVIALHRLFNIPTQVTNPAEGILVLLETEGKKVGLFVDELVGQHQVVIKSLETNYRKVPGVSGATILGDGRVAMIIDVGALVKLAQQ